MKVYLATLVLPVFLLLPAISIPPPQCFANFRWDDCGKKPEPVMYYWKPGSRCEVGIWRGCEPNINMFKNEYECVSTCIFSVRGKAIDYHKHKSEEFEDGDDIGSTTEKTSGNGTDGGNGTDSNSTVTSNVTEGGNDTVAPKEVVTGGPDAEPGPEPAPETETEPEPEPET